MNSNHPFKDMTPRRAFHRVIVSYSTIGEEKPYLPNL